MFAFQKWMIYHPFLDATDRGIQMIQLWMLFRPVSSGAHERAKERLTQHTPVNTFSAKLISKLPYLECTSMVWAVSYTHAKMSGGHTIQWGQIVLWQQYSVLWWSRISKFMRLALCLWSLSRHNSPRQRLWETARCSLSLWTKLQNIDITKYSCLRSVEWHKHG